ncbi:TraR/DksA C4-type zinc finger protein, partial [Candidatus Parcubacteria bacterium]|nr:TraR/DksA C4-type zinc finger protein [Candidatus Parcubacteria bacterium]
CSICGEKINPKRLEVMPEATLCIKCSERKK